MKIAVACSDARMIQVYDNLVRDFDVIKINKETNFFQLPKLDAIILPVKGVDEQGHVITEDVAFPIPELFWQQQHANMRIFSGLHNTYLEQLPFKKYYYMEAQKVISENAILTAEGVLNEFIGCSNLSIYDLSVDVIGYGNCGKVIYEMLHNLHVDVRVVRRICSSEKVNCISADAWKQCADVIINTSIQKLMDKDRMESWNKIPVIIDIATPQVIDIKVAEALGIRVLRAGNLPGRYACVSAGNIIACYIRGILKDER